VEPAEDGHGDDASVLGKEMAVLQERSRHSLRRLGNAGPERCVRSSPIVEVAKLEESTSEMVLGERDEEVETLTAEGSDESLAESIGFWGSGWSPEEFDAEVLDGLSHFGREQDVAVEDEEAIGMVERKSFAELLGDPPRDWVGGDVDVQDSARLDFHEDEDVEDLEAYGDDGEKVGGDDGVGVVPDEGGPGLGAAFTTPRVLPDHVLAHCPRGNPESKLDADLVTDALFTPSCDPQKLHPARKLKGGTLSMPSGSGLTSVRADEEAHGNPRRRIKVVDESVGTDVFRSVGGLTLVGRSSGGVAEEAIVVVEAAEERYGNDASVLGKLVPVLGQWRGNSLGRLGNAGSQ